MKPTSHIRFAIAGDRITTECRHGLDAFLHAGLIAEPRITRSLRRFARQRQNTGKDWRTVIETFAEIEGLGEGIWANTYDHANLLRPGARYFQFDSLVILQPHCETDARTGYGDPQCFRDDIDWLYRHGEAVLAPKGDPFTHWVTTDGGETWQAGGAYPDLHEFQGSIDPADRGNGKLFVSPIEGQGFCPCTGGRLLLHLPSPTSVNLAATPIFAPPCAYKAAQHASVGSDACLPLPATPARYRSNSDFRRS